MLIFGVGHFNEVKSKVQQFFAHLISFSSEHFMNKIL